MKKLTTLLVALLILSGVYAQETKKHKPSGKPFVEVFTNFHSTFIDGQSHQAFEMQRANLGYGFKMNENFSGKVTFDVGNPVVGKLKMNAYLKYAFTMQFGLIGLQQFKMQEKQWGGGYLYKSFQDQHRFCSSADLAIHAKYDFSKKFSVDATIANGDRYKNLESDSLLKYSLGVTTVLAKGLGFRVYYDFMGLEDVQRLFHSI